MAQVEVSTTIRRSAEDIHRFLADFHNHTRFLPPESFRGLKPGGPADGPANQLQLELHLLHRWWPLTLRNGEEVLGKRLVQSATAPMEMKITWGLTAQKADRRGPKTTVLLSVEYKVPGGTVGRVLDALVLKNETLKVYDRVLRQLPIVLEGPPKSGLKAEEPEL